MWAMQYIQCDKPRSFITSGGLGTMGYGLPAAIGAKAARPDATVVCIDGDGCFQMTCQELATAALERLPIVVVILNNGWLGMVRQWQEMFYDERFAQTHLTHAAPDYAQLAEAMAARASPSSNEDELEDALAAAFDAGRSAVVDVALRPRGEVLPDDPRGRRRDRHHRGARRDEVGAGVTRTRSPSELEDKPGALARVSQLFSRRGYNIQSLAVGPTERPDISRLTLRVDCSEHSLEQIEKQMHKLVNVLRVTELRPGRGGRARARADHRRASARPAARAVALSQVARRACRRHRPRCDHLRVRRTPRSARGVRRARSSSTACASSSAPGASAFAARRRQARRRPSVKTDERNQHMAEIIKAGNVDLLTGRSRCSDTAARATRTR